MKRTPTVALLLGLVCAVPASASYFFNSQWGTMLNVGSAPDPTPDQLRAIGDSSYPTVAARTPGKRAVAQSRATLGGEREVYKGILAAQASPTQEKRVTAELNRASLVRAKTASSKAAGAKTIAATKAAAGKTVTIKKTAAAPAKAVNLKASAKAKQTKSRS